MATPSTSPYASPAAVQTAVLPPAATQPGHQTAASRRSFRSFVEAMDDFSGDRRDVAGMRQMLAMQEANQRIAAAQPAAPVARSFAPEQAQPEVPVVRGPIQGSALPRPNAANVLPSLPVAPAAAAAPRAEPAAVQVSALPRLPTPGQASDIPTLVIDPAKLSPGAGHVAGERIVAYMPVRSNAAAPPAAAPVSTDQNLPQQLRSPLVDEMRQATRAGARPGLSDETMARFADRKRAISAPMPPRLMAQEARWDRDAWQAKVRASTATPPTTTASAEPVATGLPRLPTTPTVQ